MSKLYSIRIPPASLNSNVKLTDFTLNGTISINGVVTKSKIITALGPSNLLNGIATSHVTVNNLGQLVYVFQRFSIQDGPQKYKTPVGWRLQEPLLLCILTIEGVSGASGNLDFGYSMGGNQGHGKG